MSNESYTANKRRKVVKEEEYHEGLSNVVQRQFFPDLPNLAAQAALQQRRAAGDVAGAVAIRRAMRQQQDARDKPDEGESLTEFHTRVTSEDNAEFATQQAKEVTENRRRLRIEYGQWQRLANSANVKGDPLKGLPPSTSHYPSPVPMASTQFDATPHRPSLQQLSEQAQKVAADGLFLLPNATASLSASKEQLLALPPSTNSTRESMPPPSLGGSQPQVSSLAEFLPKQDNNERKKRIEPAATRFPKAVTTRTETSALSKYHDNAGLNLEESDTDDAASSLDYSSATDASTDLDAPPALDLATERLLGRRRRQRELETLVPMTPVIVPGKTSLSTQSTNGDDNVEPLMTWGEVSATPLVLGGKAGNDDENANTREPSFGLEASVRDQAAEQARRRIEERARLATNPRRRKTPSRPGSTIFRGLSGSMSRPASARSASSFGTALRSSYTPRLGSASRRRQSPSRSGHVHRATPKVISHKE